MVSNLSYIIIMAEPKNLLGQVFERLKQGQVIYSFVASYFHCFNIVLRWIFMCVLSCFGYCLQDKYQGSPFIQIKSHAISCLSCFWNRTCVCCFGLQLEKVSLSHSDIYTYEKWIDDKCLVIKKCLCKLMMIIWCAMPCYYHIITMLKLLIFTWHLIYDCILWYWPCLYYFCI